MNENGKANAVTVDCAACKQRFGVTLPALAILNTPTVSVAVGTHEKPIKCPRCGVHYILGARFLADWSMVQISPEDAARLTGSAIIAPPPGLIVH